MATRHDSATQTAGLLDLCEPLFAYVCTLSRGGRAKAPLTPERARGDLQEIFDRMRHEAANQRGLSSQLSAVEPALHGFVDSTIQRSKLPFAGSWRPMSWDLPDADRAFEDMFYAHLDRALQERGPEADERLAVFYTCLCLGFRGDPMKRTPEFLSSTLDKLLPAVKRYQKSAWPRGGEKICPETYEHTDERTLWAPMGVPLATIVIILVLGAVVVLATTTVLLIDTRGELASSLRKINAGWGTSASGPADPSGEATQ